MDMSTHETSEMDNHTTEQSVRHGGNQEGGAALLLPTYFLPSPCIYFPKLPLARAKDTRKQQC